MSHTQLFIQKCIAQIKSHQETVTPIREAILLVLGQTDQPLTARQILINITQNGVPAHRATVYRDIDWCVRKGFINSYTFKDKPVLYYELATDHHHHLVCEGCGRVETVYPEEVEEGIKAFEANLANTLGFSISSHRLKFYGTCHTCQSLNTKEYE